MAATRSRLLAAASLTAFFLAFLAVTVAPTAAECPLGMIGCTGPSPAPSTTTTTAPPPAPAPPGDPGTGAGTPQLSSSAAAQLLQLANSERSGAGLPPLAMRDDVTEIANGWSVEMDKADAISHNDAYFTSATRSRLGARSLGENVGTSGSVEDVHRRLMASPPHRANLMNPRYTVAGMAAARTGGGQWFVTQNFVEPVPGGPASAAPAARSTTVSGPATRTSGGSRAPAAAARRSAPSTVAPAPVGEEVAASEGSVDSTEEAVTPALAEGLTTADQQAMMVHAEGAAAPAPQRAGRYPGGHVPGWATAALVLAVAAVAAGGASAGLRAVNGAIRPRRPATVVTTATGGRTV